ncbi:MAG: hypothetical protein HC836_22845 [Richelia sp. RM2_1_2]|nr:hypothetical protein [Richelia sp. RM2_1_2]
MTTSEYLNGFAPATLVSEALAYDLGKAFRRQNPMHVEESKQKVINSLKATPKSDIHRKRLSESKKGKSWGKHTEETIKRMKESGKKEDEKRKKLGWKPTPMSELARIKLSIERKDTRYWAHLHYPGVNHYNKGRKLNLTDEQKSNKSKKRCEFLKKNHNHLRMNTQIELLTIVWLKENNIAFEQQYLLRDLRLGYWLYDFFIPMYNLLLEIDGEYPHRTYQAYTRDIRKQNNAIKCGFSFLRLSDHNLDFSLIHATKECQIAHSNDVLGSRTQCLRTKY